MTRPGEKWISGFGRSNSPMMTARSCCLYIETPVILNLLRILFIYIISDMTSLISSVYIPFHGFTLISVLFAFPRTTLSINSGDGVIKLLQMLNKFVFSLSSLPVQRCSLLVHRQSVVICFLFVFPHLVRAPASNSFPPVEPPLLPPASCLRHTLSHTINSQTMMQFVSFCFFVGLPVPTSVTPRGSRPIICPSAEVKKNQFHIPYTSSPHTWGGAPCAARCAAALI